MTDPPPSEPPASSAPDQGDKAPTPAVPESPPIDYHATPDGHRPAAWENLPPPQIVRAEVEKPPEGADLWKQRLGEIVHTRAFVQGVVALVGVLVIVGLWWAFQPRLTLESHLGALDMFCRALEDRDVEGMRATTAGIATQLCDAVLPRIAALEETGEASPFADARPYTGGASPGALAVSAYVTCEGVNGDDFLRINMRLERQSDDTWRITEMDFQDL